MNSILIASLGLYVTNKKVSLSCYGDKKYNLDDGFSSIISCSKLISLYWTTGWLQEN